MSGPLLEFALDDSALVNDLIEPTIESRQRFGDAIGALIRAVCTGARWRVRVGNPFELPRQRVETLIDGGKVIATGVLVVVRTPI